MNYKITQVKSLTLIDAVLPEINSKSLALLKNSLLVLSFSLLTALSAQIKVEIGPVPLTMQTFFVLLSGALLGSKKGAFSQLVYLFGGLAGIPWFSRGGGIIYILSPSFGYIVGFVLAAFFTGLFCERGFDRQIKMAFLAILVGNIILYIPGLLWLARFIGFEKVLAAGFYPFILGDLLKISLIGAILPISWNLIKRSHSI